MKKETTKEREKIKFKNYLILAAIFILTILLVLYISKWYQVYSDYQKETPVIRGTLSYEITNAELDHYIMENPSCVVYMCTASSDNCRNFEKDFKKLIEKKDLQDSILYLNLSDIEDMNTFVNEFNDKYDYKVKLTGNYPALIEFNEGKITAFIEGSKNNSLTITKASQFIDLHHIGEEE